MHEYIILIQTFYISASSDTCADPSMRVFGTIDILEICSNNYIQSTRIRSNRTTFSCSRWTKTLCHDFGGLLLQLHRRLNELLWSKTAQVSSIVRQNSDSKKRFGKSEQEPPMIGLRVEQKLQLY